MRSCVVITLLCVTLIGASAQDHLATLGISEGRAKEAVFDSFMSDAISIAGKPAAFTAMSSDGARRARRLRADPGAHVRRERRLQAPLRGSPRGQRPRSAARGPDRRRRSSPSSAPASRTRSPRCASSSTRSRRSSARRLKKAGNRCAHQLHRDGERRQAQTSSRRILKEQRADQVRRRNLAMKAFEKTYPADPRALVAMRLRRFLDLTNRH